MNLPALAAPRLRHTRMNPLLRLAIVLIVGQAHGANFYNLDFESANNLPAPVNFLAVSNALPGWSAYNFSGNQLSTIEYQAIFNVLPPPVILVGSNRAVLSGNFSVLLANGSIAQTGVIPSGTESVTFQASFLGPGSLTLSFDDQNVPYFTIGAGANSSGDPYTIYGANIAALAGQTETMDFFGRDAFLDDIQFSAQPVPEPSGLALLGLGGAGLICVRGRRFSSKFIRRRSEAMARQEVQSSKSEKA